ncbi:MAG: SpoIID/LytB domain-containing protein [Clostridia bacterium]|nr:SpoIID/LytB domain-containing protein [Clostridia bacterium]
MKIRKILLLFAVCLFCSLSVSAFDSPKIKVGLNYADSAIAGEVTLSFENGFQVGYVADDCMFMPFNFFAYEKAIVKADSDSIRILGDDGDLLYEGYSGVAIGICPISSELDGEDHISYTKIGSIKYPEVLQFSANSGRITIINILDAELYFKGVLPSEVYPSWHEEALKAAAIATRTYTYHSMSGKHLYLGFDVCDTTCCQVYSGITKCQSSTNKAVEDTRNLILTYNGGLITSVYHAISGGITESAAGAWGGNPENYPYLTVVETPFENYSEIARGHWTKTLHVEDFYSLISASQFAGKISSSIVDITIDDDTPGYLNNMTLTDDTGRSIFLNTSSDIRSFFSVLSSNFTIGKVYTPQPYATDSASVITADGIEEYSAGTYAAILSASGKETVGGIKRAYFLNGKGHGHGVGLSQYGAQYAAKAGYTYEEILAVYFPGTIIENYALYQQN